MVQLLKEQLRQHSLSTSLANTAAVTGTGLAPTSAANQDMSSDELNIGLESPTVVSDVVQLPQSTSEPLGQSV